MKGIVPDISSSCHPSPSIYQLQRVQASEPLEELSRSSLVIAHCAISNPSDGSLFMLLPWLAAILIKLPSLSSLIAYPSGADFEPGHSSRFSQMSSVPVLEQFGRMVGCSPRQKEEDVQRADPHKPTSRVGRECIEPPGYLETRWRGARRSDTARSLGLWQRREFGQRGPLPMGSTSISSSVRWTGSQESPDPIHPRA